MFPESLIAERTKQIELSGIRKMFELGKSLKDPVNLSIGQPHFDVPEPIKSAAKAAIDAGHNGYTVTQGIPELLAAMRADVQRRDPGQVTRAADDQQRERVPLGRHPPADGRDRLLDGFEPVGGEVVLGLQLGERGPRLRERGQQPLILVVDILVGQLHRRPRRRRRACVTVTSESDSVWILYVILRGA